MEVVRTESKNSSNDTDAHVLWSEEPPWNTEEKSKETLHADKSTETKGTGPAIASGPTVEAGDTGCPDNFK